MSYVIKPARSVAAGTPVAPRSPRRWIPNWLRPEWSRILGHRPRAAVTGRPVKLRDGSKVRIRQIQPADAPLLADGFARLSGKSRQMRFLARKDRLSAAELRYFTDLDHRDHEALGALDQADGRGVGIARYVRDAKDPRAAEVAVTIVDDWQGRGLGTELLSRLSDRARQAGIDRFTALAAAVAPGGMLLVVGHHPSDLATGVPRPPMPEVFYTPDEIAALLDDSWRVAVSEARPRPATTPDGAEVTVHDTVLVAIRPGP